MQLTVTKYLCPFCEEWHSVGEPEFTTHFPTDEEQAIMMGRNNDGREVRQDTDRV